MNQSEIRINLESQVLNVAYSFRIIRWPYSGAEALFRANLCWRGTRIQVNHKSNRVTELGEFILAGRRNTAMDGFEGILGEEEIENIIILMRSWQE